MSNTMRLEYDWEDDAYKSYLLYVAMMRARLLIVRAIAARGKQ